MKRKLLALTLTTSLLFGCIGHFSYSQAEEAVGSWQVKTSTELGFDSVYSIKTDTIIGQKDGKVAVWNSEKNQVVTTEYDEIEASLSEEGITVSKKQKGKNEKLFAVIDAKTGNLLYELGEYTWLGTSTIMNEFYDKIIYVEANGKYGTIDKTGNTLIPIVHDKEVTYIGVDYTASGKKPAGYTYHFMTGKNSSSGLLYALYEDSGKRLTDYSYTEIYDNIHYIGRNEENHQNIISKELIAEKPNGEIGFLLDGKEIGFNRTVADATNQEIVELVRISCKDAEYFVQAVYQSKSLFDELAIEWGAFFNPSYNALISSTSDFSSNYYDSQNLKVLETEEGISFQCYDMEGNVVDKKVLIEQLKANIQATKESKEQETKLKDSVKDVIRATDFSDIISQKDFDSDFQDIEITGQYFEGDEDSTIKIIIDKKHSKYYADFSVTFSYNYKWGKDSYNSKRSYDMIAILDNEKKILKYGVKMGSFSESGYLYSDSGKCLLRDEQENLYYYCYNDDKIIDKILLTKQDIPNLSTAGFKDDFIEVISRNKEGYIFDLDGNLLKEYRAFNLGTIDNQSVRMLIPSDNLNKVEYYDRNWELIDALDISFMEENIQSTEALALELVSGGLLLSNDDVISVITLDGKAYVVSRDEADYLSKDNYFSVQYSAGNYYIECNKSRTIYSLSEHKPLFTLEDSLQLDSYHDYMEILGKTYWVYRQYQKEDKKSYYGLVDENGEIAVDGIKEKLIKQSITYHSSGYSTIYFENESGDKLYYYGTPLTAHAEEPKPADIIISGTPWSYSEKIGELIYKSKYPFYEEDKTWFYDEIVLDAAENILCEAKKNQKRSIGFLTNEKYIVTADNWWNGDSADTEETGTPATATPSQTPARTPEPAIPNYPIVIPTATPNITSTLIPSQTATPAATPAPTATVTPSTEPTITPLPTTEPSFTETPAPTNSPSENIPILKPTTQPPVDNDTNSTSSTSKKLSKGDKISNKKTGAVYTITKTGKNRTVEYRSILKKNTRQLTIPANVKLKGKTYKVTSIADNALKNNKKLKKVNIGKNVTKVGNNAFQGCSSLQHIILPAKVKAIGNKAFYNCKNLHYIQVNTKKLTAKSIGKNAFGKGFIVPRIKSDKSKWHSYRNIFTAKGMSSQALYVIEPVKLIL